MNADSTTKLLARCYAALSKEGHSEALLEDIREELALKTGVSPGIITLFFEASLRKGEVAVEKLAALEALYL